MGGWGLFTTKQINTIPIAIYSTVLENRPPLNLQLCFLKVLGREFYYPQDLVINYSKLSVKIMS